MLRQLLILAALTSALAFLNGCGFGGKSKPANFYILSGLPESTPPVQPAGTSQATLGVGQVKIPNFLDRPQIVILVAENQIKLSEFNRWGESFQSGLTRVLRENVAVYLGENDVTAFPWLRAYPNDYVVHVVVLAFEAAPYREEVLLRVMYRITDPKQTNTYLSKEARFSVPLTATGERYEPIVEAMSQAVALLAKDIAQEVVALPLPTQAQ